MAKVENLKRIKEITGELYNIEGELNKLSSAKKESTRVSFFSKYPNGSDYRLDFKLNHKEDDTANVLVNNVLDFHAKGLQKEKKKLIKELGEL